MRLQADASWLSAKKMFGSAVPKTWKSWPSSKLSHHTPDNIWAYSNHRRSRPCTFCYHSLVHATHGPTTAADNVSCGIMDSDSSMLSPLAGTAPYGGRLATASNLRCVACSCCRGWLLIHFQHGQHHQCEHPEHCSTGLSQALQLTWEAAISRACLSSAALGAQCCRQGETKLDQQLANNSDSLLRMNRGRTQHQAVGGLDEAHDAERRPLLHTSWHQHAGEYRGNLRNHLPSLTTFHQSQHDEQAGLSCMWWLLTS